MSAPECPRWPEPGRTSGSSSGQCLGLQGTSLRAWARDLYSVSSSSDDGLPSCTPLPLIRGARWPTGAAFPLPSRRGSVTGSTALLCVNSTAAPPYGTTAHLRRPTVGKMGAPLRRFGPFPLPRDKTFDGRSRYHSAGYYRSSETIGWGSSPRGDSSGYG